MKPIYIAIPLLMIGLSACHNDPFSVKPEVKIDKSKLGAPASEPVYLNNPANGSTVSVKAGQALTVALPANQTTPYLWGVDMSAASALMKSGDTYGTRPTQGSVPPPPGTGGTRTFTFDRVSAGPATLTFAYANGANAPLKTVRLTVTD